MVGYDKMCPQCYAHGCDEVDKSPNTRYDERPTRYGNGDANGWRVGPAEYDYMHRYDSPDNERDSMG